MLYFAFLYRLPQVILVNTKPIVNLFEKWFVKNYTKHDKAQIVGSFLQPTAYVLAV